MFSNSKLYFCINKKMETVLSLPFNKKFFNPQVNVIARNMYASIYARANRQIIFKLSSNPYKQLPTKKKKITPA